MNLEDNAMGLTPEQTEKILQFQDLTGIEDMSICRDVLYRHQWDLEVAIQEQLNIREGRPSVFATEALAPPVVHDHIAQQVFTDEPPEGPGGMRGLFQYVVNLVVSVCYSTLTSVLNLLLSFIRNDDRRLVTDPLGDVMGFINHYTSRYNAHPVFYQGTYAQALNDAKNELRFLVVYLHSEAAPETQNFCRMECKTRDDPDGVEAPAAMQVEASGAGTVAVRDRALAIQNNRESERRKQRSLSEKLPTPWPGGQRASSGTSVDDLDLWLAFLVETGLIRMSEPNAAVPDMQDTLGRNDTRVDDPDFIINQLSFYKNIPNHYVYDYEEIHRNTPGLFWDTVTMDDPDVAFYKVKNIVKNIVESQKKLTPMFEIDFANISAYTTVQKRLNNIRDQIAPQRLFY